MTRNEKNQQGKTKNGLQYYIFPQKEFGEKRRLQEDVFIYANLMKEKVVDLNLIKIKKNLLISIKRNQAQIRIIIKKRRNLAVLK